MPTIICTVGLSNSGKSTWAEGAKILLNADGYKCEIICRDDIHNDLHGNRYDPEYDDTVSYLEVLRAKRCFSNEVYTIGNMRIPGLGCVVVIICACHHKREYRDRWREICVQHGWELQFQVFDTPVEECIRRAEVKGDGYIIPVIRKQAAEFEPLTEEETRCRE